MVVKMKHLELLLYHKEREQFLQSLRSLGVVHILEDSEQEELPHIQELQGIIRLCDRVNSNLKQIKKEKELSFASIHQGNPDRDYWSI